MKKMLCTVLMIIGLMFNSVQACDIRDEQGRTQLINFVIQVQAQIADKKTKYQNLYNRCYQKTDDQKRELSVTCTDEDLSDLWVSKKELQVCIASAKDAIKNLVAAGVDVNVKDYAGKTVINYVQTQELYDELRNLGAHYQLEADIYFHGMSYLFKVSIAAMILGASFIALEQFNISAQERQDFAKQALESFLIKTGGVVHQNK